MQRTDGKAADRPPQKSGSSPEMFMPVAGAGRRPTTWWERALLIAAAVALIKPGLGTDLLGIACFGLAALSQRARARRAPAPADEGARLS